MRPPKVLATLATIGLIVAGCGWSPPGGPQPRADNCTAADGPTPETVSQEISRLPAAPDGALWQETARGHTADCRLSWVQVGPKPAAPDSPGQVLFFDAGRPIGTPTPEPRPYVNVVTSTGDTVTVQYQWKQGSDQPCCPTGIGTARFQSVDGRLVALDPVPNA